MKRGLHARGCCLGSYGGRGFDPTRLPFPVSRVTCRCGLAKPPCRISTHPDPAAHLHIVLRSFAERDQFVCRGSSLMVTALGKAGFHRRIWDPLMVVLRVTPPRHELWPWQKAAADTGSPQCPHLVLPGHRELPSPPPRPSRPHPGLRRGPSLFMSLTSLGLWGHVPSCPGTFRSLGHLGKSEASLPSLLQNLMLHHVSQRLFGKKLSRTLE